jgi:hypothetical protein
LSYVSVGSGANPGTTGQAAADQPGPEKKDSGNVVSKGLHGMFGKKEKQNDNNAQSSSLMDMTTEVTSITPGSVDTSLFEIPSGFKQVQPKKDAAGR